MKWRMLGIAVLLGVTVSLILYLLFDRYVSSAGVDSVQTWLKIEENSIAEGNLLTSVTKSQKMLLTSDFVKGLGIFDLSTDSKRTLIEFGQIPNFVPFEGDKVILRSGFLKWRIFIRPPQQKDLVIGFSIGSDRIVQIFWATDLAFLVLIAVFSLVLMTIVRRDQIKIQAYAKLASRAAHDLAHPLLVLNSLASKIGNSGEETETLKAVIERINVIVDDLGTKKKSQHEQKSVPLATRIKGLVDEKRVRAGGRIDFHLSLPENIYNSTIGENELIRTLANLIDNSIEAISDDGTIKLTVDSDQTGFSTIVEDNGNGIPASILSKIGTQGFTHGKASGSGVGVSAAREFAEGLGGSLTISSQVGVGTKVTLSIPTFQIAKPIFLAEDTEILVLDDEQICHDAYRKFFESKNVEGQVKYFYSPESLRAHLEQTNRDNVFLFSDLNLGGTVDGLAVISSSGLIGQSIVVTGAATDPTVRRRASRLGVDLFNKENLQDLQLELL